DPGRIEGMRPWLGEVVTGLIDAFGGRNRVDIVDDFAYPFPVTVICRILGVPREDEARFRGWVDVVVETIDPRLARDPEQLRKRDGALAEFRQYLAELLEAHRRQPGDDLLSGLVADPGPEGPCQRVSCSAPPGCCSSPVTRRRSTSSPTGCSRCCG